MSEKNKTKFNMIKNNYKQARYDECTELASFLREKGFSARVSHGKENYTSGRNLSKPFDLSNWLLINASKNNVNFVISFQAFDKDPNSKNLHVLMDRIGIYAYTGKYSAVDAQTKMITTSFNLPLYNDDMESIAKTLDSLCEDTQGKQDIIQKTLK